MGRWARIGAVVALAMCALAGASAGAEAPADGAFWRTWARTDQPVAAGVAARTWMWGPAATSGVLTEEYAQAPGTLREVQYFDKARMEITHPDAVDDGVWYVSNGLLVTELVTGALQVGDGELRDRAPAQIAVAGDADDVLGPTYATFALLRHAQPAADGTTIIQQVSRAGQITDDARLASWGVTAAQRVQVAGIDHQVASPFWEFMTAVGTVYQDGAYASGPLFQNPFYATGYPLSEAYWASVKVGGVRQDVLVQCFERRCLTYTPGNADGWQVESGNVGQHYFRWRYDAWPGEAPVGGELLYHSTLSDWQPFSSDAGSGYVAGGSYHLRNTSPDGDYLWYRADDAPDASQLGDVRVAVDVRQLEGGPNAYGCLLARATPASEAPTLTHTYSMCIDGFGAVSVLYETWDATGSYAYRWLMEYVASDAVHGVGDWNRLEIVARGERFWFLVNGDLLGTAMHAGPANGAVGVLVSNFQAGAAEFEFRELDVRAV